MFGDYGSIGGTEIIGAAEIIGGMSDQELSQLVGASPNFNRFMTRMKSVVHHGPSKDRRLMTGVPATSVSASTKADIECKPQELFRTEMVCVPSDIAYFFVFNDVKVGMKSQLVGSGDVPCANFIENAVNSWVHWDTAVQGNTITLTVTNIDSAAHTFRATLFGTAAL